MERFLLPFPGSHKAQVMKLSPALLSVRTVLVVILLLVLLPILGAVGLMLISNAHLQQQAIEASLKGRARSLAAEVDVRFEELAARLEGVMPAHPITPEQLDGARRAAERRLAERADWQAIALLNPEYQQLMLAGVPPAEGIERLSRQLRGAANSHRINMLTAAAPGGRVITGIAVSARQGTTLTAIALGIPRPATLLPRLNRFDRSEGALTGLIAPGSELIATSSPTMAGTGWPDPQIRLTSEAASGKTAKISIAGRPSYVATARLHLAPWFIVYAVPADVIEAPLRVSGRLIGGLALLVTVPLLLVLLLGHFLAEQIRALTLTTDALAHEQSPSAVRPSPIREVAAVQQALQQAAEMTQERTQARERLRAAELNLARLQRLDTVGQLAAGIAHDFGNYLFTIRGNLDLVRAATAENQPAQERIIPTIALAQEALQLVQQLSALARRRSIGACQIKVDEVLQEIRELLRHVAGRGIRLEFNVAPRLWDCQFDPLRLHSVLVNLVTNARDAMPEGGTIRIRARNLTLGPERAALLGTPTGRFVELAVSDTGVGMSPETVAHVFEPFFTSKPADQGNGGIGLSILYGWVTAAGGKVLVESALNIGTTFTILLPEHKIPSPVRAAKP